MKLGAIKTTGLTLALGSTLILAENANADNVRFYGAWQQGGEYNSVTGYGARLSLGAPFGVELGYNRFNSLELDVDDDINVEVGGVDADVFDLGLRFGLPLNFYLGGGASYFKIDDRNSFLDDKVGLYALGGWSVGSESVRVFGEGIYRYAESTLDYIIGEEDVTLDSWGFNAGIMFQW